MIDTTLAAVFISQWRVFIIVSALLLASAEIGYWFGLRLHRAKDESRRNLVSGTLGAILGLLALLLGFTFAMSASRYDARRELVLTEANAIGTTYLRAGLLPQPHRDQVELLLRKYVDVRLDFYGAGEDLNAVAAAEKAAAEVQQKLWARAQAVSEEKPTPIVGLFVQALNDTIDVDAMRLHAMRSRVPGEIWLLVLSVAMSGCLAGGYQEGSYGARSALNHLLLPLLVALVITLIADLDRPRGGLIGISQQPLIDLRTSMGSSATGADHK